MRILHRNKRLLVISLVVLVSLATGAAAPAASRPAAQPALQPVTRFAEKYDLSRPLAELAVEAGPPAPAEASAAGERLELPKAAAAPSPWADAALQTLPGLPEGLQSPPTEFNFEGVSNINGVLPPDTNGDVGPNHYVQWVNLSLQIWSLDRNTKTATSVLGPVAGNTIWNGFGGQCESTNAGDPVVLYDHLADRWLISQFAVNGPFYECIAISQTPDPTGAWHRYAFLISNTKMNDYPKLGVWPDGYYMTMNQFVGLNWGGAGVAVFERDKMLLGQTARMVYFDLFGVNSNFGGMLPSDLDGPPPPAGTPNYFAEMDDASWIPPVDALRIWEFKVDWVNTANSTFGVGGQPNQTLDLAAFTPLCVGSSNCIPQQGTSVRLDAIADRLMHRLQYRNFGGNAVLVTNHTVDAGSGRAGVRWYELNQPSGGSWSLAQQGTYAGDSADGVHRWMASAAMDSAGNIAIGYSASSSSMYPAIRYTGRLKTDPANTLPQGEATLFAGTGAQTHSANRWGDYSMLSVDPADNCTFWFTSEYLQTTSNASWRTRVGSFVFPGCLVTAKGAISGTISTVGEGLPIGNALVQAGGFHTLSGPDGSYQIGNLPAGAYSVTVSAYDFQPVTRQGVVVASGQTTVENFALAPANKITLSGIVYDNSGHNWPIYARLQISAPGFSQQVFTNPATGAYSVTLSADIAHGLVVSGAWPGYRSQNDSFTPTGDLLRNYFLMIDGILCSAPGYDPQGGCHSVPGGLALGNVSDLNTGLPLNGASLAPTANPTKAVLSAATPDDPALGDGFYTLFFAGAGTQDMLASYPAKNYAAITETVSMALNGRVWQDVLLPAGDITVAPGGITVTLQAASQVTRTLVLQNIGSASAGYTLVEVNGPALQAQPTGPFAAATRHVSPKRLFELDSRHVYEYNPPVTGLWAGGQVLGSWLSQLQSPWGLGFHLRDGSLWLSNAASGGGDDHNYRFTPGSPPGLSVGAGDAETVFVGDMAFDALQNTFWQTRLGGDGCIFEFDPAAARLTGRKVCPAFGAPQRGLAFDPLTRTFYSGSWTNRILYHFDENGIMLDSAELPVSIAGLAFNPATRHLFVTSNAAAGYDLYVFDAQPGYPLLGGFDIAGLGDYSQAGLELDCAGRLWTVNRGALEYLQVESGEGGVCAWADVSWLSVTPAAGIVSASGSQPVTLNIATTGAALGLNQAHLLLVAQTPYGDQTIPVNLIVTPLQMFLPVVQK